MCAIDMAWIRQILNDDFAFNADISNGTPAACCLARHQQRRVVHSILFGDVYHPGGFGLAEGDYAVTIDQTTGDFNAAWSGYMNIWVHDIGPLGYSPRSGQWRWGRAP